MDQVHLFNSIFDVFCGIAICMILRLHGPIALHYQLKNDHLEAANRAEYARQKAHELEMQLNQQKLDELHARTQAFAYWMKHQDDCNLQELGWELFDSCADVGFILGEHKLP